MHDIWGDEQKKYKEWNATVVLRITLTTHFVSVMWWFGYDDQWAIL